MATMTPDQFFDALDELFGTDDGYVNHLKRIIDLKHLKEEMEENWLSEEDVSAQVDPLYEEIKNTKKNAMKQVHKLNKQLKELKEENKKLKQFKDDVIDASQWDNDATVADHEYIDYIKEMESAYDMELKEKITCLESDSMNEVSQVEFDEMVEEKDEEIKELKHQLTQQKGKYDFLKETSINKTMNTNSTDDIIKLEKENKELKLKLQASREVSTCYAKVVSQSPERKVEEILKRLVISPESAKKVASMIPDEKINCHKCVEMGTTDSPVGGATDEDGKPICDSCYDNEDVM